MKKSTMIATAFVMAFTAASCGVASDDTVLPQGVPTTAEPGIAASAEAVTVDEIEDPAVADEPAERETTTTMTTTTTVAAADGRQCIVRLHGKGGNGRDASTDDNGFRSVRPTGNEDGWGGRQWIYFPDDRYREARDVVGTAIAAESCDAVVINGFSNGAAFAAAMFCNGESFGGVVRGYVIDDPVTDTATENCTPAADVRVVMYWTGDIARTPGTNCSAIDWTCAGNTTVDVDTYASRMGASITPSPFSEHSWYWDAPEIVGFFG